MESINDIQIHKGRGLKKNNQNNDGIKTIVFDLDETIGSFSELYILFKCIEYIKNELKLSIFDNDKDFLFQLLDLFPEFFRYGIHIIFPYLHCHKNVKLVLRNKLISIFKTFCINIKIITFFMIMLLF